MMNNPPPLSLPHTLNLHANKAKALLCQRFFKTAPGQYGHGDIFLGLTVPQQRKIAKQYLHLTLSELQSILQTNIHEQRLTSLIILTEQYKRATKENNPSQQKAIYTLYLNNTKYINNWDLVDVTAPQIVGNYLLDKDRNILYQLAKSSHLWEKRISIVSTFTFIRNHQFHDTLVISKLLLNDHHDLIHKAVGWMLREVGKKDQSILEQFLKQHLNQLPRTTLRYAIEKFPEQKRKEYLNGNKSLKYTKYYK